jgi:sugar lactone lactonase YvrE
VIRYDPDGRIERRVEIPAKQTSSLIFGGPDLTDIFITSAAKPDPTPVMPTGYNPNSGYLGGALYRINLGIQGKPEFIANIKAPSLTCP